MKFFYSINILLLVAYSASSGKGRTFSYVVTSTVDPLYGVGLESSVSAVDLALDYINNNSSLLQGLNLTYSDVNLLECPADERALEDILTGVHNSAVLGFSCTRMPDLELDQILNFSSVIHYTPAPILNATDQLVMFGLHPSPSSYARTLVTLMNRFQWQRVLTVTQGEEYFSDVLDSIKIEFRSTNITLFELEQNSTNRDSIDFPDDVRIIFLNMNSINAANTVCKGYSLGLSFPRYVWITYTGGFEEAVLRANCSLEADFLDGAFTLLPGPVEANRVTQNGIILADLLAHLEEEMDTFSPLSYYAIDAVLTLTHAINDTLAGWSNNSPDWSFCELQNEVNKSSLSRCFIRQKIQNVMLEGLTGEISFNEQGERVVNVIGLHQFRREAGSATFPQSQIVARITVNAGGSEESFFEFYDGENETTIFRGSVPADGTPIKNVSVLPLPLIIIYYTLIVFGLIFTIICFLFNIFFRKRKIVKLISPKLNYFIVMGGIILYLSVIIRMFPNTSELYVLVRCNLQTVMTCLGYLLCFAPVLMKMWRVYYIFHNPSPNKKVLKDWHLFLGSSIIVGVIVVLLCLGFIPFLRSNPMLVPDVERPTGITNDGIRIENCINNCYGFSPSLAWIAIEYLYMLSIQVAALVLAIITRKVKIRVLNDSKEMAIIVYTSTSVMLVLGVITFATGSRLILNEILFSGGIIIATTVFLTLVFIPKMVDLYRDPRGEGIFGQSGNTNNASFTASTNLNKSGTLDETLTL